MRHVLITLVFTLITGVLYAQSSTTFHYNQVGYFPSAEKLAVIGGAAADTFRILNGKDEYVFSGKLSPEAYWEKSGQYVRTADFSGLSTPGVYRIMCGADVSGAFEIGENIYSGLVRASAKYYYFNRASTSLPELFAGEYHRPLAHPDTATVIHQTAATPNRPAGMHIPTARGWYDAGDYNKYIVNSGITTFTLLLAFEENQSLFDTLTWNIPESTNALPDLLDEIRWNLEWMLTMQDPDDGGLYHKNTAANFEGFVPPHQATSTRYVIQKSTAATLDFAAVMAHAARIYDPFDPVFAAKMREQAIKAWGWAMEHPDVLFTNPGDSGDDGPAISTGAYGDRSVQDEFFWAAAELYLTTQQEVYLKATVEFWMPSFRVPSWGAVETLGLMALSGGIHAVDTLKTSVDSELLKIASELQQVTERSPYHIPLNEFRWGSSSDILNQGIVLLRAWRISGNDDFRNNALSCLDYVLGRNASGISCAPGMGDNYRVEVPNTLGSRKC